MHRIFSVVVALFLSLPLHTPLLFACGGETATIQPPVRVGWKVETDSRVRNDTPEAFDGIVYLENKYCRMGFSQAELGKELHQQNAAQGCRVSELELGVFRLFATFGLSMRADDQITGGSDLEDERNEFCVFNQPVIRAGIWTIYRAEKGDVARCPQDSTIPNQYL